MAEYVPNTVVKVCKDVPLDNTYTDTRWFSSAGEQAGFFSGKAKYTFNNMTYQRVNNGIAQPRVALTCRVPMIADNLYDCNYLMFQNTNYGSKWFYAFIKQVNYINPNNTEIVYEIDYLQTFMFEMKIKPSFVEREHASAAEDVPFANLTPEPVEVPTWCEDLDNHYRLDLETLGVGHNDYIVIAVVPNSAITSLLLGYAGEIYSGVYSGATFIPFTTAQAANSFILSLAAVDQASAIVDVFMSPSNPKTGSGATTFNVNTNISLTSLDFNTVRGAYTARNKKLLNSQFTYIKGSSDTGQEMAWKPELCRTDTLTGACKVAYLPTFSMHFLPAYMGHSGTGYEAMEYGLPFEQSVHTVWSSQGWLGDMVKTGLKVVAGLAIGGAAGAAGAVASTAQSSALALPAHGALIPVLETTYESIPAPTPNQPASGSTALANNQFGDIADTLQVRGQAARGSFAGDAMTFAMHLHGFEFRRMCPDALTLERLDTFFDMFGYQVNKVKAPNLDTRAAWNYVKLKTPCIYGSVPVEGMSAIKAAFTRGIRLWHVDAVGDYSIQNPPK